MKGGGGLKNLQEAGVSRLWKSWPYLVLRPGCTYIVSLVTQVSHFTKVEVAFSLQMTPMASRVAILFLPMAINSHS